MASRPFLAAPLAPPSPADVVAWRFVGLKHWGVVTFWTADNLRYCLERDKIVELRLRNSQRVIIRSKHK